MFLIIANDLLDNTSFINFLLVNLIHLVFVSSVNPDPTTFTTITYLFNFVVIVLFWLLDFPQNSSLLKYWNGTTPINNY